MKISEM